MKYGDTSVWTVDGWSSVNGSWSDLKDGWQDEDYKTVDFGTSVQVVSEEFKTWLEANATKQ